MNMMYDQSVAKNWTQLSTQISIDLDQQLDLGKLGSAHPAFSYFRNQMVAVKILPRDKPSQRYLENLEQRINLEHPYVLEYYGNLQKEDKIYLLFEYCPNGTLDKLIARGLSQTEVLRLFRQLVEGMNFMHSEKRLLQELRPQNILIGPEENIKLCDIPCLIERRSKAEQQWVRAVYGAPQALLSEHQSQNYSEKSIIWSIGLLVYEMLTGKCLLKEVENYDSLKRQWLKFQRGFTVNILNNKYHPLWNSFMNSILTFSPNLRPTLQDLYQKVAIIYKPLRTQLYQINFALPLDLQNIFTYCKYTVKKYDMLLELCQKFTSNDIRLCNEFKYLIMFCCIMRYISFCKGFEENITKRLFIVNHQNLLNDKAKEHPYITPILGQFVVVAKQKCQFYKHQIKSNIVPKVLQKYCQRSQSQQILKDLNIIVELIRLQEKGGSTYQEEKYQEAFKMILVAIEQRHGDVTKYYSHQQLKLYYSILNTMLLSENYPEDKYQDLKKIQQQQTSLQIMHKEELIQGIRGLANQIF